MFFPFAVRNTGIQSHSHQQSYCSLLEWGWTIEQDHQVFSKAGSQLHEKRTSAIFCRGSLWPPVSPAQSSMLWVGRLGAKTFNVRKQALFGWCVSFAVGSIGIQTITLPPTKLLLTLAPVSPAWIWVLWVGGQDFRWCFPSFLRMILI